ncbi:MAG: chorismate-binding protein [Bdellovibrionales bacterium]|nr:chorismate-binding protein [Bdellovibrionales bacterium]
MNSRPLNLQNWLNEGAFLGSKGGTYTLSEGPFELDSGGIPGKFSWLLAPFFIDPLKPLNWTTGQTAIEWSTEAFENSIFNQKNLEIPPPLEPWVAPSKEQFKEMFFEAQSLFQAQQLEKIVPVVFEKRQQSVTAGTLIQWLKNAFRSSTKGYLFGKWNLSEGWGVLGLTPELFFQKEMSLPLQTMALAGTAQNPQHDLLQDTKELNEHDIVVNEMTNVFSKYGFVHKTKPYVWSPGSLQHLRTDIDVELKQLDVEPLIKDLHPTPALGGTPKDTALEILRKWNLKTERGFFGAPFGFQSSDGRCQFVVTIRCLMWKGEEVFLGSGCGLVPESQWEREWEELTRKRDSVKKVFGVDHASN